MFVRLFSLVLMLIALQDIPQFLCNLVVKYQYSIRNQNIVQLVVHTRHFEFLHLLCLYPSDTYTCRIILEITKAEHLRNVENSSRRSNPKASLQIVLPTEDFIVLCSVVLEQVCSSIILELGIPCASLVPSLAFDSQEMKWMSFASFFLISKVRFCELLDVYSSSQVAIVRCRFRPIFRASILERKKSSHLIVQYYNTSLMWKIKSYLD